MDNEAVESLDDLIDRHRRADAAAKQAADYRDDLKARIIYRMAAGREKRHTVDVDSDPSKQYRAVYSANTRISIDGEGLKKALGARRFYALCDRKVSAEKLNDAVEKGKVDPVLAAQHLKTTDHPSVRFYLVDRKEDEEGDQTHAADG